MEINQNRVRRAELDSKRVRSAMKSEHVASAINVYGLPKESDPFWEKFRFGKLFHLRCACREQQGSFGFIYAKCPLDHSMKSDDRFQGSLALRLNSDRLAWAQQNSLHDLCKKGIRSD
jgi:hypothetical protein